MKKIFKTLVLSVLCMAVTSVAAFAAKNITVNSDGTFLASYSKATEGEYYALVVVEGIYTRTETPAISEETVCHIDQVTAGEDGALFDEFTPNSSEPATVYVGGSDLTDGPVILGYINSEGMFVEYTVNVEVKADSDAEATVKFTSEEFEAVYNETTAKYEADVPEGTYTLTVEVPKHLSYTMNEFEVSADVEKSVTVKGGDVDSSGTIDEVDLGNILTDFASTESEYDITGEGTVDEVDLGIVLTNFSASSIVE